jgi:hypothetical protein
MVELQPSKLVVRVRFPSPAPLVDVVSPGQRRFLRTVFLRGPTRRYVSFPGRPRDGRGTSAGRSAEEQVDARDSPDVHGLARRVGLIAEWDEDARALASWMLTWQRIAVDVAVVSGLVMLALLVYVAWERLSR